MIGRGIAADDEQAGGVFVVGVGVAGRAAAQGGQHSLNRRRVAETGAVVDVVALHDQTGEFLLDVAVLVGRLGRTQGGEGGASVVGQAVGDQV